MGTADSDNLPEAEAPAAGLGFTFQLSGGAGKLLLSEERFFGWAGFDRLELEVPNLALPVDLAAGPEQFQRRRTRALSAAVSLTPADLERIVAAAGPHMAQLGTDELALRCADGYLSLTARVRDGRHAGEVLARVYALGSAARTRLVVAGAQTFGYLPTPAPLLAHRILLALLRAGDGVPGPVRTRAIGLGDVEIEPLRALLWHILPAHGWRLPDVGGLSLSAIDIGADGAVLGYATGPSQVPASAADAGAVAASLGELRAADDLLCTGDYEAALRSYRGELTARGPDDRLVIERILAVATAVPEYFSDAAELARQALGRRPEFGPAHAALATIAVAQGDPAAAAARYRRLAEAAADVGDDEASVRAALAGARLLRPLAPDGSTELYERVLAHRPGDPEAAEALAERYQAQERWPELVRLIRFRIQATPVPVLRARDHVRLAEILAHKLGDLDAARAELERACELDPQNAAAFDALADIAVATGDDGAATAALATAADLHARRGDRRGEAAAHRRAASLCERRGDDDAALSRFLHALEVHAGDLDALRGAARVASRRGRHRDALVLWSRLAELESDAPPDRARASLELGRAALALGELERARAALERAARAGFADTEPVARALLADLHRARGDAATAARELDAAVRRLADAAAEDADAPGAAASDRDADRGGTTAALRDRAARLSLDRAALLAAAGDDDGARDELERAHDLAGTNAVATRAATALYDAACAAGDLDRQAQWLDAILAAPAPDGDRDSDGGDAAADERRGELHLARAALTRRRADPSRDPSRETIERALADLDFALAGATPPRRAEALALKAEYLAALGDASGRARALVARAEVAADPAAAVDAAEAYLAAGDDAAALALAREATDDLPPPSPTSDADNDLEGAAADADAQAEHRRRVLTVLGEAAWRQRAWSSVRRAYAELVYSAEPPAGAGSLRALFAHRLGVALDADGDLEAAAAALEVTAADAEAPANLRADANRLLAALHERLGNRPEAARAFEAFAADDAARAGDAARADAWYRAGGLHRKQGDDDGAERCLEAALALAQDHLPALDILERMKREHGDFERVAVILSRKIAATAGHPNRQKSLLCRLAALYHDELGRTDVARETYGRALEIDSDYRPALRFIAEDARAHRDHERATGALARLARMLPGDADLPDDAEALAEERVQAALALVDIAGRERSDPRYLEAAAGAVNENLASAPGDERLISCLYALRGTAQQWTPQQPPEQTHDQTHDQTDRDAPPAHPASASGAETAADDEPASGAALLRELAERAAAAGDYAHCAEMLEQAAIELGAGAGDENDDDASGGPDSAIPRSPELAELLLSLADLYYDELSDPARARRALRRAAAALGAGSRRGATLRLLAAEAFSHEAYAEAADAYEAIEPKKRTTADQLNLAKSHLRLARDQRAIGVLEEARRRGALSDEGAMLLFALHRERKRKADLAAALERGADAADDPIAATRLREALSIFEHSLDDTESAERVRALIATRERAGEDGAATSTPEELEHAAEAASEVGDVAVAADLLARAVTERARQAAANGVPLAPDALDRLRQVAEPAGHHDALSRGLLAVAAVVADPQAERALLVEAAEIKRARLHDHRGAADCLTRALALTPGDWELCRALDGVLREAGEVPELAAAYELHLGAASGKDRARPLVELARLHRDLLGDAERAERDLQQARDADPDYVAREEPQFSLASRLRMGATMEARGQAEAAIAHYEDAAREAPRDRRPLVALERLYAQSGEGDRLAHVLGRLIALSADPDERAALWYRRAKLFLAHHDEPSAYHCLKAAHDERPKDSRVAHALRAIAMARDEWALAAELLHREIAAASEQGDDAHAGALYLELALIYDEKLLDPARATESYEQALALDPSIPAAPRPLGRLYELAGRHADAARAYERAAAHASGDAERASIFRLAASSAEHAGMEAEARRLADLAIAAGDPGRSGVRRLPVAPAGEDGGAAEALARRLRDTDDRDEKIELGRQLLELATAAGDEEAMARHAATLFDLAPADASAFVALRRHATATGGREALARILATRADAIDDAGERAALLYELGRLRERDADDAAAAARAYEQALAADPEHAGALEALAELAYRHGDWARAGELFASLRPDRCSMSVDTVECRRGDIAEKRGRDEEARAAFEAAIAASSSNRHALEGLFRIARRTGDTERAVDALEALAAVTAEPERRAALLYDLGELCRGELGDPDRAAEAYIKAIDLAPSYVQAMRRLLDHYWRTDDPRGVCDIAAELLARDALLCEDTGADAVAHASVMAAIAGAEAVPGADRIAAAALAWLDDADARVAAALLEAAERAGITHQALAEAAARLAGAGAVSLEAMRDWIAQRAADSGAAKLLADELVTMQ